MYDKILDILTPTLAPTRARALDPLRTRVIDTRATLARLADEHGDLAERASLIDLARLKNKMAPALYDAAGRVKLFALDLRNDLDRADIPVDVRAGFRTAVAAVRDDEFAATLTLLQRDVGRYEGTARHASTSLKSLLAQFAVLRDAPALFSDTFEVQPMPAWSAS